MYTITDINLKLKQAAICQFLSSDDNSQWLATNGSVSPSSLKTPLLIRYCRSVIQERKAADLGTASLNNCVTYMMSLCIKNLGKAQNILNGSTGLIAYNPVLNTGAINVGIKGITIELKVGAGLDLEPGATSYTINYPFIIENTVRVELPQSNIPEGETNQFSYTIVYSRDYAIINFTNDDGLGNNLGVQPGMLIMIFALRALAIAGSTIPPTSTLPLPPTKFFTGANLNINKEYVDADYAGYGLLIDYLGFRKLMPSEYQVLITGGVKILLAGDYTVNEVFTITPNGLV